MKTATILGQEIKIRNDDYKKLLRRFDVGNANKEGLIQASCSLCGRHFTGGTYFVGNCGDCPFSVLQTGYDFGCIKWMLSLGSITEKYLDDVNLYRNYIVVYTENGRKAIQRIHQSLVEDF